MFYVSRDKDDLSNNFYLIIHLIIKIFYTNSILINGLFKMAFGVNYFYNEIKSY